MRFMLTFHGEMRWLVALVAVAVLARSLLGWTRASAFGKPDRILMTVMTVLLDLNLVLGVVLLLLVPGGLLPHRIEHAGTMVLAVAAGHLWAIWRRSDDPVRKFRNNFFVAAAVLLLVATGVLRLRGAWLF